MELLFAVIGAVWRVALDPMSEAGPFNIRASLEGQEYSIQLSDVLFGDVWLCGGENNMQLSVSMVSKTAPSSGIFFLNS